MCPKIKSKNIKAGFSLIEILISLFIVAVSFSGFYAISSFGTRYIIESKNKLAATAFVNEKMEIIRNLSYDKVGTQGSIDIPGNLLQEQSVVANGKTYQVSTDVRYFDDPMDGTVSSASADVIPNDYKIVKVVVSWIDSNGQARSVYSSSRFVPPGLETSAGGSPLSINVIDGETLLPISQAAVNIRNSTLSPQINDTINTDSNGHILLPSARISSGDKVTITKSGYETIETLDSSGTFIPIYGHINVIAGFLNTYNYVQNKLAKLTVKTLDYQNNPVGNIQFSIGGGKVIGHDGADDVFSMSNTTATTDSAEGKKVYSDINSGNYTIVMNPNSQYEFIDYDPSETPFFLAPDSDSTYKLFLADKDINALFLEIKNTEVPTSSPIAGAKVTLTYSGTDVFTDKLSSLRGIVYYPDGSDPLPSGTYALKIEADGYEPYNGSVEIDKLTHEVVQLTKN